MYINPIACGVILCVMLELSILFCVAAFSEYRENKKRYRRSSNSKR